jgi:hypothetical protein
MTGRITPVILVMFCLSAVVTSGCTRIDRPRQDKPPPSSVEADQDPSEIDQLLDELEQELYDLDRTLAESECWTLDPP